MTWHPTIADVKAASRVFFEWWGRELAELVPEALRPRTPPVLTWMLRCAETETVMSRRLAGAEEEANPVEVWRSPCPVAALPDKDWQALAAEIDNGVLEIWLEAPWLYSTRVQLPLEARHRLKATARLQLSQIAPLEPDALLYDAQRLPKRVRRNFIDVAIAIVRRDLVDDLLGRCARFGLPSPRVLGHGREGVCFTFLAPAQVQQATTERRREARLLVSFGVLLLLASPGLEALARWQTGKIEARLGQLERDMEAQLRETAGQVWATRLSEAIGPLIQAPPVSHYINELALLLPPDRALAAGGRDARQRPGAATGTGPQHGRSARPGRRADRGAPAGPEWARNHGVGRYRRPRPGAGAPDCVASMGSGPRASGRTQSAHHGGPSGRHASNHGGSVARHLGTIPGGALMTLLGRLLAALHGLVVLAIVGLASAMLAAPPALPLPARVVTTPNMVKPRPVVSIEAALEQPIFNPARQFPAEASDIEEAAPEALPLPELVGLVESRGDRLALFREAGSTNVEIVRQGRSIAGWQVAAIRASQVTLWREGEAVVLRLDPTGQSVSTTPVTTSMMQGAPLVGVPAPSDAQPAEMAGEE